MPLPVVQAGLAGRKPFVVSARHPNGAYAVAVLPRTVLSRRQYVGGKVAVEIEGLTEKIALFGWADCIEFVLKNGGVVRTVSVQSLIGGKRIDISCAFINETRRFTIEKEIIEKAWKMKDQSAPSLICKIEYAKS